jgi:hypothetical protein
VSCGVEQATCFELAGRACPDGYYYAPILDPHDNNFFVRCRVPKSGTAVATGAEPPPNGSTPVAVMHGPTVATRADVPGASAPPSNTTVDFGY